MEKQITWQQFRNDIKNKSFMHEGKNISGWNLPMHKQTKMYADLLNRRATTSAYINSGIRNV
jgi:hypothetical protein